MDRAFQRIRSLMLRGTFYSVPPIDSPITLSDRRNLINKNELTEYSLKSKALDIINIYENTYNTSLIDKRIILMDTLSIHKKAASEKP